jgi:hypothetical protein
VRTAHIQTRAPRRVCFLCPCQVAAARTRVWVCVAEDADWGCPRCYWQLRGLDKGFWAKCLQAALTADSPSGAYRVEVVSNTKLFPFKPPPYCQREHCVATSAPPRLLALCCAPRRRQTRRLRVCTWLCAQIRWSSIRSRLRACTFIDSRAPSSLCSLSPLRRLLASMASKRCACLRTYPRCVHGQTREAHPHACSVSQRRLHAPHNQPRVPPACATRCTHIIYATCVPAWCV